MADNIRRFGFLGSRELLDTSNNRALVQRVVGNIGHVERLIGVGCASGADALCLDVLLRHGNAPLLTVFAAFDATGGGTAGAASNVVGVWSAAAQGVCVRWLVGGGLHLPVGERLATRTRALVNWVAAGGPRSGVFAFLSRANSYGSAAAMKHAATAGLGVIAFPCGIPASALPELGAGQRLSEWLRDDPTDVRAYRWQQLLALARELNSKHDQRTARNLAEPVNLAVKLLNSGSYEVAVSILAGQQQLGSQIDRLLQDGQTLVATQQAQASEQHGDYKQAAVDWDKAQQTLCRSGLPLDYQAAVLDATGNLERRSLAANQRYQQQGWVREQLAGAVAACQRGDYSKAEQHLLTTLDVAEATSSSEVSKAGAAFAVPTRG